VEILRATITISEDAARTARIVYQADAAVDLEAMLGTTLNYSYSAGSAGAFGGGALFNGVILSANYDPSSDTVTATASDLRKVILGALSNDEIDDLIPSIVAIDADIVGYERITKRLEMAPGHVELDVNRKPRYTDYNSNAGVVSVASEDAICEPLVGSAASGSSPVNEVTLNVAYSYPVLRTRLMTFKWEAPQNYFKRQLGSDLRLPVWDGVRDALSSIDCRVIKVGARFLQAPGLIDMFTGADAPSATSVGPGSGKFLWLGDPHVKKVSAVAATIEDRWTQNITEHFKVVVSAGSSRQLGVSKKAVSVDFATEYDSSVWEEDLDALDFNLVSPEKGSAENPDISGAFDGKKTYLTSSNSWKEGAKLQDTGETKQGVRDYKELNKVVYLEVEKARVAIQRSHRIGRTTVTSIIDPSADVNKLLSITLNKVSSSGKVGNVVFNIDHEKNTAQMTATSYNSIFKGGADSTLAVTEDLDLDIIPEDNVNLQIEGGNIQYVGSVFDGLNGACYSEGDGYSLTSYDVRKQGGEGEGQDPNSQVGYGYTKTGANSDLRKKLEAIEEANKLTQHYTLTADGTFRFCVSPPDVSAESIDKFDIDRPEAKQKISVKI